MRRHVVGSMRLLVLPTIGLLAVVLFAPGRTTLALRFYALLLCAIGLGLALSALRRTYPAATPLRARRSRKKKARSIPPGLARLEHELALGVAGAFDLHFRVLPRLRALTAGLLEQRRRISLETDPEAARLILGDEAWGLVRPDRRPPADRLAGGIPPADLRRAIDALERV